MNKTVLMLLMVMMAGCTQIPLLGSNCGTVTPGQNHACCRRQNAGKTTLDCNGNWYYNWDTSKCEYKCYDDLYETCDAMTQCADGTCTHLTGEAYCVDIDPCELVDCENDCVLLESYPVQVMCQ